MQSKEMEDRIISSYKQDEKMMCLVFAQWCVNQDLNPDEIYKKAYPEQEENPILKEALELTVPKEEAGEIAFSTVMNVLSLFGNDDLAVVLTEVNETLKSNHRKPF